MRCAVLVLLVPAALFSESLPRIEGENLAGKTVVLPNAASERMAILIAGFTHASQHQTKPWDERLRHEFLDPSKVTVYPVAPLAGVPRMVRGMAAHGIKSGTPKEERERFLLLYHYEAELKQAAGFAQPDDAYVILLDRTGSIRWRFHGPVSDGAVAQVRGQVQSLDPAAAK